MPTPTFIVPEHPIEDAHIIRRLGSGVANLWHTLPEDVRERLLEQAILVHDDDERMNLKQDIERFLRDRFRA